MSIKMPVLFIGHGNPMNAIENNSFSKTWEVIGETLPTPKAILCISAHWYTKNTRINDTQTPKQIYDFYGFPRELFNKKYPVSGAPKLARQTQSLLANSIIDNTWGIDHGAWSVLCRMYKDATIPTYQLSVDYTAPAKTHYETGQKLSPLRDQGVLIIGSGNVVHNLGRLDWNRKGGFDWAEDFDNYIKNNILNYNHSNVIDYQNSGKSSALAFETPDHYFPLLYSLGASNESDKISVFNDSCALGSISMTSYLFQ